MPDHKNILEEFAKKFATDSLKVIDTPAWRLSVRPTQLTFGSLVISSRAIRANFSELSSEDERDFFTTVRAAEHISYKVLGASKANFLCLMMQDALLHFHVFPRYSETPVFMGKEFKDKYWPAPIDVPNAEPIDVDILALQKHLVASFDVDINTSADQS